MFISYIICVCDAQFLTLLNATGTWNITGSGPSGTDLKTVTHIPYEGGLAADVRIDQFELTYVVDTDTIFPIFQTISGTIRLRLNASYIGRIGGGSGGLTYDHVNVRLVRDPLIEDTTSQSIPLPYSEFYVAIGDGGVSREEYFRTR